MDEVGRGAFAGPLVAAAVVLPRGFRHPWLRDSKKLTAHQREVVAEEVHRRASPVRSRRSPPPTSTATDWAGQTWKCSPPGHRGHGGRLLLRRTAPDRCRPPRPLPGGGGRPGAADLGGLDRRQGASRRPDAPPPPGCPGVRLASNKGYGAPVHRAAILAHGVHPEHRRVFIENLLQLQLDLGWTSRPRPRWRDPAGADPSWRELPRPTCAAPGCRPTCAPPGSRGGEVVSPPRSRTHHHNTHLRPRFRDGRRHPPFLPPASPHG